MAQWLSIGSVSGSLLGAKPDSESLQLQTPSKTVFGLVSGLQTPHMIFGAIIYVSISSGILFLYGFVAYV